MIIDNRPPSELEESEGGGGGGAEIADVAAAWRVDDLSIAGLDIINGYVSLNNIPEDAKVLVFFPEGPVPVPGVDYTINVASARIEFLPDCLAHLSDLFNKYGTLSVKAAYYSE